MTYPMIKAQVNDSDVAAIQLKLQGKWTCYVPVSVCRGKVETVDAGHIRVDGIVYPTVQQDGLTFIPWPGIAPGVKPKRKTDGSVAYWDFITPDYTKVASPTNYVDVVIYNDQVLFQLPTLDGKALVADPIQLDTGAQILMLYQDQAQILGLVKKSDTEVRGVSGKPIPAYVSSVGFQLAHVAYPDEPVLVTESADTSNPLFGLHFFVEHNLGFQLDVDKNRLYIG